jgi:carbonic anhydrase
MLRRVALVFLILSFQGLNPLAARAAKPGSHGWSYEGKEGPAHWGDLSPEFAACKSGREQSPIDIRRAKRASLPPIIFDYQPSALRMVDNGHTIQVNYGAGSSITVGGHRYELRQFHFHHPSEEKINGKPHAMVVHLVHADAEGNLAVVAVLLDPGRANALIRTLWDHLPRKKGKESVAQNLRINAVGLLPASRGYYTYKGSLTTPPCTENVTWFILKSPVQLSPAQISAFARRYPNNSRPVQPLNGRTVLQTR